jgi:putative acetyltransferase
MIDIREGGLGHPDVEGLLHLHRTEARSTTPADNAHSLSSGELAGEGICFFSAWIEGALVGIGAIKSIDATHAEIKSMRTHPQHLRKGVAQTMLDHLIQVARRAGSLRLSLETGTAPMFAASHRLYARNGFVDCAAFGGYPPSPHNRFMTLEL